MENDKQNPGLVLTMPLVGVQDEKSTDKLGTGVGWALLIVGVVFNYWVVAKVLSSDGEIESTSVRAIIWILDALLVVIGAFILRHPCYGRGFLVVALPFLSVSVCSLILFSMLELFPSLIKYMPFANTHYYWLKARYIADEELVFRNRPFLKFEMASFKGDLYRDWYGVDVKVMPYREVYDEHGFRNALIAHGGWDIAVLGDSYIEFGHDEGDTFSSRLAALSGLRARNLGTAAYGPFQYLTVLKRHGLREKPRYVLFCFFEGNDITEIRQYLRWKEAGVAYGGFKLTGKNFVQRYVIALTDVVFGPMVRAVEQIDQRSPETHESLHPDLAVLKVGGATIKTVFSYKSDTRTPDELVKMSEWSILKELLGQFKVICAENDIVPIVMFIPTKAHIYAEHSSTHSGANWMAIRDQQIAARENVETAFRELCREIGIELISLSPAFEQAAKQGKFLYYPFDTHWNSEGRQVAASVLADTLSSRHAKN